MMLVGLMLRAALIGFAIQRQNHPLPAHDQRAGDRAVGARQRARRSIGISKVPDARLDRLTAMYNPRKRVPATVEFTDLAVPGRTGARRRSSTSRAYKNADALVHVLRAFQDPAVPHPSGSVDPARDAQAMEDELILADLGVAERRSSGSEKDLKKSRTAELERERDVVTLCKAALEDGRPLRALDLKGEDLKRLRGFQFLSAKPLLIVINLDEAQLAEGGDTATRVDRAAEAAGLTSFLSRAGRRPSPCARRSSSRSRSSTRRRRGGVSRRPRPERVGARSRDSRQLRSARLHFVLHGRRGRVPRLVDSAQHARHSSRPARFTATSRAASSAPRSSATIR